jgi:hypothetical protein
MLILYFVGYTHLWLNGQNTFVKVCVYKEAGVKHSALYHYPIHPDASCKKTLSTKKGVNV